MYRKAKRDANETKIIAYLRRCGASVQQLDDPGVPDLLVGYCGLALLMEVKTKQGKLTDAQVAFMADWQGHVSVVRSISDVKQILRGIMPVYVYLCKKCGYQFEHAQAMQDLPLKKCPNCSGKLHRVVQPTAVIFRGTGWGKDK